MVVPKQNYILFSMSNTMRVVLPHYGRTVTLSLDMIHLFMLVCASLLYINLPMSMSYWSGEGKESSSWTN